MAGEKDCLWSACAWWRWKEFRLTESDVADIVGAGGIDAGDALQLERRVVPEEHLGRVLDGSPPGVDELLEEHLPEDAIRLFAEDGGEDDGDAVVARLDVDGLLLAVVDSSDLAALLHTLGRRLGCVF